MGREAGHDEWNIQIKVNPTQVRDLLNHPVWRMISSLARCVPCVCVCVCVCVEGGRVLAKVANEKL